MKKCLTLLIATVLSGISLTAYAAQPMSNLDSSQLRPAGTVSATGASNLSDLEDKLAEKAREQGAKGYIINSAGGNDQMFGTATCNQVNHLIPTRVLVKGGEITCKILK